jgi:hypothetical protein
MSVKERENSFKEWSFCQAFKARKELQEEVREERMRLKPTLDTAEFRYDEARSKVDGIRQNEDPIEFRQVELRERWLRIHRIRDNEFKGPGIRQVPKKSRRAEKKEKREAVYAFELSIRASEEFHLKGEGLYEAEDGNAGYEETQVEDEQEEQGVPEEQNDRRGPATDRHSSDPPPCKGAARGSLQERAGSRHDGQLSSARGNNGLSGNAALLEKIQVKVQSPSNQRHASTYAIGIPSELRR